MITGKCQHDFLKMFQKHQPTRSLKSFEQVNKCFGDDEAAEEGEADDDGVGDAANLRRKDLGRHNPDQGPVSGVAQESVMKTFLIWLPHEQLLASWL